MFTSWYPWELEQKSEFMKGVPNGISLISSKDPFVEKILVGTIKKHFKQQSKELHFLVGNEITRETAEDNFFSLSLFGGSESYYVLHAETLSKDVRDFIVENHEKLGERSLILCFFGEGDYVKKTSTKYNIKAEKINEPRFWETEKLLKFFASKMGLKNLGPRMTEYILSHVENDSFHFVPVLREIFNLTQEGITKESEIIKHIETSKIDNFELAKLLGKKNFEGLFSRFFEVTHDFELIVPLCSFLQGYCLSLMTAQGKEAKSRYDRELQSFSRNWTQDQSLAYANFFGKLLIEAKKKNPLLREWMISNRPLF